MIPFSELQSKTHINATQLYEALLDAQIKFRSYRGSMTWKRAKGREYLFRVRDNYGNGESLGARTPETEKIYDTFYRNKSKIKSKFKSLRDEVKAHAPVCKSLKIQRVPIIAAKILRELDQRRLLGDHIIVIGTNALYAYEAAAGVIFENKSIATEDMDILWDIRSKLKLGIRKDTKPEDFIDVLRRIDKTFDIYQGQNYRASNDKGYMVDLLKAMPSPAHKIERDQIGGPDDLKAIEVKNLSWLLSAPKFEQIAIGFDGIPVRIVAPDPRAFALHKFWVCEQVDRDPRKKGRDQEQAIAVAQLVMEHLPYLKFAEEEMRMFPARLLRKFTSAIEERDNDEDFSLGF
ncbi:MAG: nucleotidyltransferase domain-containing protein [Desulfobacterales bacterium]|nr:nucleotidyltransferase domain-containing protein [Desulfobacterales bacterium]